MEIKIIRYIPETAQVVIMFDDGKYYPDIAVDLPIDETGRIPEGRDLINFLEGFLPNDERRKQIEATGVVNAHTITVHPISEIKLQFSLEAEIRGTRDQKLQITDWTQLADATITEHEKLMWAEYRQALRDITTQEKFSFSVSWPVEPIL